MLRRLRSRRGRRRDGRSYRSRSPSTVLHSLQRHGPVELQRCGQDVSPNLVFAAVGNRLFAVAMLDREPGVAVAVVVWDGCSARGSGGGDVPQVGGGTGGLQVQRRGCDGRVDGDRDEAGCAAPGSVVDLVGEAVGADEERVGCVDEASRLRARRRVRLQGSSAARVDGERVAVFVVVVAEESRCGDGKWRRLPCGVGVGAGIGSSGCGTGVDRHGAGRRCSRAVGRRRR